MVEYCAIIEGDEILVGTENTDFMNVISYIIKRNPCNKVTLYEYRDLRFCYFSRYDYWFIIACNKNIDYRICINCIEYIYGDFQERFIHKQTKLNKNTYRLWLKSTVHELLTNPESDKLKKLLIEVDDIKNIMIQNVKKANERGEKIERALDETEILNDNAMIFHKNAKDLKCKKCLKYYCCCFASCCCCFFPSHR